MVDKDRDRDRERDQGQPKAKASPEKVEKEVKETRGTSHSEKFEARALDGHHRDYILLLFVGLAWRTPLFVFLFLFLSDPRIASHSPFACKWWNKLWDNKPIVVHFLSNKGGTSNIRILCASSELHLTPYMRDVCHVWVGLEPYIKKKMSCLLFFWFR